MSEPLGRLAEIIAAETGIRITPERMRWLAAAAQRLAGDDGPHSLVRAANDPARFRHTLQRLVDEVTIRETFFLRDARQLDAIEWRGRLENARRAGSEVVRVWCAACASGEEAYSLVLLAAEALGWPPPIHVLGTDISNAAIEHARRGRYGSRAIRLLPEAHVRDHFDRDGAAYEVGQTLRGYVEFALHNLVRDPPPRGGTFDLVLCRNVLMYFEDEAINKAVGTLRGALAPNGQLVLGVVDRLCLGTAPAARLGQRRPSQRAAPAHAGAKRARERSARQPRHLENQGSGEALERAMRLADAGELGLALEVLGDSANVHTMDPAVRFLEGTLRLACGDAQGAVAALRAALYADPSFALAAFQLGRAHDALGDPGAARKAYQRALLSIDPADSRHETLMGTMDLADVARACEVRLRS